MKKLLPIILALSAAVFGCSCNGLSAGIGIAQESVDVGFGVYTAPDGFVYGPVKARLKSEAEPE